MQVFPIPYIATSCQHAYHLLLNFSGPPHRCFAFMTGNREWAAAGRSGRRGVTAGPCRAGEGCRERAVGGGGNQTKGQPALRPAALPPCPRRSTPPVRRVLVGRLPGHPRDIDRQSLPSPLSTCSHSPHLCRPAVTPLPSVSCHETSSLFPLLSVSWKPPLCFLS